MIPFIPADILKPSRRRMVRTIKNPMDKCTIVSILPKPIREVKYTIDPGLFIIEPGTYKNPSTLIIGPSSWWRDVDAEQPLLEIPVSSVQVADSIINDYCNGMIGCDMVNARPGLFFVLGEATPEEIVTDYADSLEQCFDKQQNWFKNLIKQADALWARSNGNPLVLSNEMRLAAQELNLKDKPWLKDYRTYELVPCIACGTLRNPEYPVCGHCKFIDPTHPLVQSGELKFAQANQ